MRQHFITRCVSSTKLLFAASWESATHSFILRKLYSPHIAVPTASIYTSVHLLGRRGRKDLTHSFDYGDDDLDPQWKSPEDTELKDMEEFITLDRQQRQLKHAEEKERLKAHKNLVKRKTIENKYFRPPATASILTWRAKEQIRYLHAEDPDEGGIHTILETFPITETDLKKLLKSKAVMRDKNDIEQHDKRTHHKWNLILTKYESLDGPLKRTLDDLIDSGQIEKIVNAGGVDGIPEVGSPTLAELARRMPAESGPFANLLLKHGKTKDNHVKYLQSDMPNTPEEKQTQLPPYHQRTLLKILKQIQRQEYEKKQSGIYDEPPVPTNLSTYRHIERHRLDNTDSGVDQNASLKLNQQGKNFIDENGEVVFRVP